MQQVRYFGRPRTRLAGDDWRCARGLESGNHILRLLGDDRNGSTPGSRHLEGAATYHRAGAHNHQGWRWALSLDVGHTIEAYGGRLLQLADWLGELHVAFGTDINGLAWNFMLSTYAELRRVMEHWQRQRVPETRIRRIASENYARVLKQAMSARHA
jgi:hypothetical protein